MFFSRGAGTGPTYDSRTGDHLAYVMENLPQEFLGLFPQSIAHAGQSTDRQEAHEGVVEEESKQTPTLSLVCRRLTVSYFKQL